MTDREARLEALSKVPAVTLGFWIIKILATTLGETGGDTVTMTWLGETTAHPVPNGYLIGTAIFGVLLIALVWAQIRARRFNPWLYWATIVASTTCGTTLADFADRSLGVGYPGGSLILLACVMISLFAWKRTLGTIDVNSVSTPRAETFYWVTITFSQTLGTALGDWIADAGLGYSGGALVFGAGAGGPRRSSISRPASATSPCSGRRSSSPARSARRSATSSTSRSPRAGSNSAGRSPRRFLAVVIIALIMLLPQRPGGHPGRDPS